MFVKLFTKKKQVFNFVFSLKFTESELGILHAHYNLSKNFEYLRSNKKIRMDNFSMYHCLNNFFTVIIK